jgi:radical SAM superfamily enzyme with C-terminal helix-hairpin-helix motif
MPHLVLVDGYIDEPASLGVPPYSSPQVRAVFGAAREAGAEVTMLSIDSVRHGTKVPSCDVLVVLSGCAVPGRYLRGMPASEREISDLASHANASFRLLGGPAVLEAKESLKARFDLIADVDAAVAANEIVRGDSPSGKWRTLDQWNRWMILGAESVLAHPDFPQPLIAELETYRGCVRYRSGGCSFCIEPLKGKPSHRQPEDVISEARKLHELGVRNFRVGAQTCIVSYLAKDDGTETPVPNPKAIDRLLSGISSLGVDVLHLDNANPAVIAEHPKEAKLALESMVRHCTSGNVLALGLESADPKVREANNLNASAEQTLEAVRLINEVGRDRGPNGLPFLLPGVNFIVGLDDEDAASLDMNLEFLRQVRKEGLLLRRINIRQVMPVRRRFESGVSHSQFLSFKKTVREEIDSRMLQDLVPVGTRLTRAFTEMREGKHTFGRQIGTYPLLIGFNYPVPLNQFVDVKVVGWGFRSITAVEYPLKINSCPIAAMESLPSIGNKRAVRLFRKRPYRSIEDVRKALDEPGLAKEIEEFIDFE